MIKFAKAAAFGLLKYSPLGSRFVGSGDGSVSFRSLNTFTALCIAGITTAISSCFDAFRLTHVFVLVPEESTCICCAALEAAVCAVDVSAFLLGRPLRFCSGVATGRAGGGDGAEKLLRNVKGSVDGSA